jgi:hypothetical protein
MLEINRTKNKLFQDFVENLREKQNSVEENCNTCEEYWMSDICKEWIKYVECGNRFSKSESITGKADCSSLWKYLLFSSFVIFSKFYYVFLISGKLWKY